MTEDPSTPSRRRYDATRRQADARERQARVLEAAAGLFVEQGYGATSIAQIARAAGVSPQSVYATFESKAGVLEAALGAARTGGEADRMHQMPAAEAVRHEPDLRARTSMVAALLRAGYDRSARLIAIVEQASATDPVLADLHARLREERRRSVALLTGPVPDSAFRRQSREEAIDAMALLVAAHTYTELVDGFGWSPDRYETWLADALYQVVFAADGAPDQPS